MRVSRGRVDHAGSRGRGGRVRRTRSSPGALSATASRRPSGYSLMTPAASRREMRLELGVQLDLQGGLVDHSGDLLLRGLPPENMRLTQALHERFDFDLLLGQRSPDHASRLKLALHLPEQRPLRWRGLRPHPLDRHRIAELAFDRLTETRI